MGNSTSKDPGHPGNPSTSQMLPEEPPYPGPSPEYRYITTEIANTGKYTLGGAGKEIITSNVDSIYPMLAGPYNENFRLMSFYKTPMIRRGGLFSATIKIPYQAIFYRYPHPNEGWRLEIEKSAVEPRAVYNHSFFNPEGSGISTDASHLIQAIARHSEQGGRLICMEETGQQVAKGFAAGLSGHLPTVGVDVFFDMPTHPNPEIYTYQMVTIPIKARGKFGGQILATCDWAAHLGQFLSQGWRLVEIFLDNSMIAGKAFSASVFMNATWIFEKPMSRVNDPTPVYQGTFIEHYVTLRGGFNSKITGDFDWEPKIDEMAKYGWELACILKTPEQRVTGVTTAQIKFIIFFQRKMISQDAPGAAGGYGQPPPSYESLKQ